MYNCGPTGVPDSNFRGGLASALELSPLWVLAARGRGILAGTVTSSVAPISIALAPHLCRNVSLSRTGSPGN